MPFNFFSSPMLLSRISLYSCFNKSDKKISGVLNYFHWGGHLFGSPFGRVVLTKLTVGNHGHVFNRFYSDKSADISVRSDPNRPKPGTKPKKEIKTYITLVGLDETKSITTIEEARKIANRRDLKLIKLLDYDPKSSRAVYQLMTESHYLKNDTESNSKNVGLPTKNCEKVVSFSSSIGEHDLRTKIKMIMKWLQKSLTIKVIITGDTSNAENVFTFIEKEIGIEGRLLQKRTKLDLRFQIYPPKKKGGA